MPGDEPITIFLRRHAFASSRASGTREKILHSKNMVTFENVALPCQAALCRAVAPLGGSSTKGLLGLGLAPFFFHSGASVRGGGRPSPMETEAPGGVCPTSACFSCDDAAHGAFAAVKPDFFDSRLLDLPAGRCKVFTSFDAADLEDLTRSSRPGGGGFLFRGISTTLASLTCTSWGLSPQQRRRISQERALGSPPYQTGPHQGSSPWRCGTDPHLQSDHGACHPQRLRPQKLRPHDDWMPWHPRHPHDPFILAQTNFRSNLRPRGNALSVILRTSSSCSRARKTAVLVRGLSALVRPIAWRPFSPFSGCRVGEASRPGPSLAFSGIVAGGCPTFAPCSWSGSFVLPIFHQASISGSSGPTVITEAMRQKIALNRAAALAKKRGLPAPGRDTPGAPDADRSLIVQPAPSSADSLNRAATSALIVPPSHVLSSSSSRPTLTVTAEQRTVIERSRLAAIARRQERDSVASRVSSPTVAPASTPVISAETSDKTISAIAALAVAEARVRRSKPACRAVTALDAVRQTHIELHLFRPTSSFCGSICGYEFKLGDLGVGYYLCDDPGRVLRLPLTDLVASNPAVTQMARNWACLDGPPDLPPAPDQDDLMGHSSAPASDAIVKKNMDCKDGVSFITFNPNAGTSLESFLGSAPPPSSVRLIGAQEMKILAVDVDSYRHRLSKLGWEAHVIP